MTGRLTEHEIEEAIGAFALNAVEDWEYDLIARAVEINPRLRAELDAHRETVAYLAEGALMPPPAPASLWEKIAAELDEAPPPLSLAPIRQARERRHFSWPRVFTGMVAAAAVIVAAVVGLGAIRSDTDRRGLPSLDLAAATAATAPGAEVLTLAAPEGVDGFSAQIVFGSDGVGYLLGDDLPALPADRAYQLWAIVDERVISAGVLGHDPGVAPFQVTGNVTGFAITEEIAGGVVSSENPALSLWIRS